MNTDTLSHFLATAHLHQSEAQTHRNHILDTGKLQPAAVLVGIVWLDHNWHIMLTRRAETLRHHTGQIAFAGGRFDPTDTSLTFTALRETEEETGISPQHWQTFPALKPYYTPTGYAVTPIPAICPTPPQWYANAAEVAEIFFIPLTLAFSTNAYTFQPINYNNHTLHLPVLHFHHHTIWGLTASILFDLAQYYSKAV